MSQPAPESDVRDLVEQHYELLYRFGYRLSGTAADAEDLTQQTFLIAQQKFDQLRQTSSARSWLCTILRNLFFKARRQQAPASLDTRPELAESDPKAETPEFDSEILQHALDELPDDFRVPLVLYYFDEFTYREIADQLQIPLGTVMSRLARGREHLKIKLTALQAALDAGPVKPA